jgi:hypothetical protein
MIGEWQAQEDSTLRSSHDWFALYHYIDGYYRLHIRSRIEPRGYEIWRWGTSDGDSVYVAGPFETLEAAMAAYMVLPVRMDLEDI